MLRALRKGPLQIFPSAAVSNCKAVMKIFLGKAVAWRLTQISDQSHVATIPGCTVKKTSDIVMISFGHTGLS